MKYYKKIVSCIFFSKFFLCVYFNILWGNVIIDVCKLFVFYYVGLESLIDFYLFLIFYEIVIELYLWFIRKWNEG